GRSVAVALSLAALNVGCAAGEAREDLGVARERTISNRGEVGVWGGVEPSVGWTAAPAATCKNGYATVVGFTHGDVAAWASNCTGSWVEKSSVTESWPLIADGFGNTATNYGSDVTVFGIPGHPGQIAYVVMMRTVLTGTTTTSKDDGVIVISNDGGETFGTPVLINTGTDAGVDRPVAVADPGATEGTIYIAWEDTTATAVEFRRATVATDGTVTLSVANEVNTPVLAAGNFTMPVEHGATNTVDFAFADHPMLHGVCSLFENQTVSWYLGSTSDDGLSWSFGSDPFDSSDIPGCAKAETSSGYRISYRPELAFNQDLGTLHVAYSKVGAHGNVAAIVRSFGGSGSGVEVDTKNTGDDQFRVSFATTPAGAGRPASASRTTLAMRPGT
ncbi:MAG TPA: hypothetical protein VHB21_15860, partial [Minicystis sp.]|nr:hypothetical protein [Minicystis sp.]